MLDLACGYPSDRLLPSDLIANSSAKTLFGPNSTYALQYDTSFQGPPATRKALAKFLTEQYGSKEVKADNLIMTNGASQSLANILLCFADVRKTKAIIVPRYAYFLAFQIFRDAGYSGRIQCVDEDKDGILPHELKSLLEYEDSSENDKTMDHSYDEGLHYRYILYLVPTFSNPTGTIMSRKRREEVLSIAYKCTLVVCDDVYDLLYFQAKGVQRWNPPPRPVELVDDWSADVLSNCSFSKLLSPGFRCGFVEGPPRLISYLSNLGHIISGSNPGHFQSNLLLSMLEDGSLAEHISKLRETYTTRCYDAVIPALEKYIKPLGVVDLPSRLPQGGYFTWITLTDLNLSAKRIGEIALRLGLRIATSSKFDSKTEGGYLSELNVIDGDSGIRISWSYLESHELVEAIKILGQAIQEHMLEIEESKQLED